MSKLEERVAVLGLGYVGLPVAVGFAKVCEWVVGFDISHERVEELKTGYDRSNEVSRSDLLESSIKLSADPQSLCDASLLIVTVPTPVDAANRPDFGPLDRACDLIGPQLRPGAIIVFESTVYPGATEEICGPRLEKSSGLTRGRDFWLGYSPERINPGDKEHTLERIVKVVAGQDGETLDRVARAYAMITEAGVHRAPSIKVAEAAKVIENIQRDLNIALMNELAVIFDRLNIRTQDVLEASATKWNFLRFSPGLVGGHCIGVDPYYLTARAESVGYHPEVILAGRRINDGMATFLARKLVKLLAGVRPSNQEKRVGVLGLTFKEDVPDLRNSKVAPLIHELTEFGLNVLVHDPLACRHEARQHYGLELDSLDNFRDLDAVVLAVPHKSYIDEPKLLHHMLRDNGIVMDVKSVLKAENMPVNSLYWSL